MASSYKGYTTEIINLCAQEYIDGGVIVGVVGRLTQKENVTSSFTRTFFLAKPDKGNFYVLNDSLQFVDVDEDNPTTQLTEDAEIDHLPDHHIPTPTSTLGEMVRDNGGTVSDESDIKHSSVEEVDVSKPQSNESQNDVVQVTKLATNAQENAQKTSYASK